eukprot:16522-Heterococcus_DN1.PRE.1
MAQSYSSSNCPRTRLCSQRTAHCSSLCYRNGTYNTSFFAAFGYPTHCCTQLQGTGVGSTRRHTAAFSSDAAAVPPTIGIASPGARSSRSVRSIGAKSNASTVSTFDRGDAAAAGYAQSPNAGHQQQLQLLSPGQLFDRSAGAAEDASR